MSVYRKFLYVAFTMLYMIPYVNTHAEQIDSISVHFRFDTDKIDTTFMDNAEQIRRLGTLLLNPSQIDSILICGHSSPDGNYAHNSRLSAARATSIHKYVVKHLTANADSTDTLNSIVRKVRTTSEDENWAGLCKIIDERYHRKDRDRVLAILQDNKVGPDTKKWRLQQLSAYGKGNTYKYIINNYMRHLRMVSCIVVYSTPVGPQPAPIDTIVPVAEPIAEPVQVVDSVQPEPQSQLEPEPEVIQEEEQTPDNCYIVNERMVVALKTNMLYDLATIVNFQVELPIGKHYSVLYEQYCPWWNNSNYSQALQLLSFGGEARRWFVPRNSRKERMGEPLTGHFLGLYAFGGVLDIQNGRKLNYQAEYFSAGLSYGFSMPIGKRLNMEFAIQGGYARIPWHHYIPSQDWSALFRDYEEQGIKHWIGPTKVEVNLVLPLYKRSFKPCNTLSHE